MSCSPIPLSLAGSWMPSSASARQQQSGSIDVFDPTQIPHQRMNRSNRFYSDHTPTQTVINGRVCVASELSNDFSVPSGSQLVRTSVSPTCVEVVSEWKPISAGSSAVVRSGQSNLHYGDSYKCLQF